ATSGSVSAQGNGPSARRIDAPRADSLRMPPRSALATQPVSQPAPTAVEAQALVVSRFEDVIALAAQERDLGVRTALERDGRLVRCEDGRLEIKLEKSASNTLVNDLARKLSQWTNRRWMVVVSAEEGQPTLRAQAEARQAELKTGVQADPLVQAGLSTLPGARRRG